MGGSDDGEAVEVHFVMSQVQQIQHSLLQVPLSEEQNAAVERIQVFAYPHNVAAALPQSDDE